MESTLSKKRNKKWRSKLLSLLLSGALLVTGVNIPTVHAAEEDSLQSEQMETEADFLETQEEIETASEEAQTQSEDDAAGGRTESNEEGAAIETQTEAETVKTEVQTEEAASEDTKDIAESMSQEDASEEETEENTEEATIPEISQIQKKIVVNPLYEGIIDADELAEQFDAQQENGAFSTKSVSSFDTLEKAAGYVREQMVARSADITATIPLSIVEESGASQDEFPEKIFNAAVEHTEECTGQEGDALRWVYSRYQYEISINQGDGTYSFVIHPQYYTTYEQEQELTAKVKKVMGDLALSGKSDYEKVRAIHDYICDTVDYDNKNLNDKEYTLKFTAYAALCTGKAVCQGYAIAFYRMCKEAGLPVRVIAGTGNGGAHAWNIVKIADNTKAAGSYYNIDCTWDGQDAETNHTFFLLNEKDFENHTRNEEYASEEFYQKYPMAETSYIDESTMEEGLNKENPDVTLTTIDDVTVSSAADGKPKLLVFFRTTCGNSISTIRAIAGHDFPGIDLYAVEIDGKSKSEVEKFKSDYGSDNINFCYDTSKSKALFYYMQAAGLTNGNSFSATLPVLCYIDANNLFQHITQGIQNASQIDANLKKYCSAVWVKQYKITYVLNGGTNHSENPSVFKENSGTIALKDPVKEGFTFAGWYLDSAFSQRVISIEQGTSCDITLYAKWKGTGAADKLNLDNLVIEFTNLEDKYVSSKANGKPKLIIFISTNCGKSQSTISGIRNGIDNVDILAVNTIKASKEEVRNFKNTYGSDAIEFSYDDYGYKNNKYLNDYVDLAGSNDIAPPTICYIDADNKFQHITTGLRSAAAIKADIDAYCSGSSSDGSTPSETYQITYVLDGGTNHKDNPASYTTDTATITLKNPTKEGYDFAGWYRDAEFKISISQIVKGSSGNLKLYAKWKDASQNPGDKTILLGTGTTIALEYDTVSYNGKEQKPKVTVQHDSKTLVIDTDYTLAYADNLNAGTALVTVTGKNQYQGTVSKNFKILPVKLEITAKDKTLYEGDPKPAPDAYEYQVKGLVEGESLLTQPTFICNVPDPVQKGTYEIIPGGAKAGANYDANITYQKGKLTVESRKEDDKDDSQYPLDKRKDLKDLDASITNIKPKVYDGDPYTPAVKVTVIENNKTITLTQGTDYRVLYDDNVNAGTGKVIVKGNGIYKGEISKEFEITKKQIKKCNVVTGGIAASQKTNLPIYVYDGENLLTEGTDYKLSELSDVKATSAKVTISAAEESNYEGSVDTKITLYNADASKIINPENVTLSEKTVTYTGKAIKSVKPTVTVNGTLLEKNKNYKVQYKNNVNAGDAYVIITGKGEYKGKVVKTFTIAPLKTTLTVKPLPAKIYNGKLQTPKLTVLDGKKKLKANKDYSIVYEDNLHKGEAAVWINGKGNYAGVQLKTTFTINAQKISKASVKGTRAEGVTITYNKKVLGEGIDYTLEYGEERKGKVEITVKGIGDFTGEMKKSIKTGVASSK